MSTVAALCFVVAAVLFLVDALQPQARLVPLGLLSLTVGLFLAIAGSGHEVHF
jgi:putative copper export protein